MPDDDVCTEATCTNAAHRNDADDADAHADRLADLLHAACRERDAALAEVERLRADIHVVRADRDLALDRLHDAMTAQEQNHAAGFRAGVEAAAEVCDDFRSDSSDDIDRTWSELGAEECARRIRALLTPPAPSAAETSARVAQTQPDQRESRPQETCGASTGIVNPEDAGVAPRPRAPSSATPPRSDAAERWPAELIERLADVEHQRWAGWMRHLFGKCVPFGSPEPGSHGPLIIPVEWVARWSDQAHRPYEFLSEREKESDRREVRKTLAAIDTAPVFGDPGPGVIHAAVRRAFAQPFHAPPRLAPDGTDLSAYEPKPAPLPEEGERCADPRCRWQRPCPEHDERAAKPDAAATGPMDSAIWLAKQAAETERDLRARLAEAERKHLDFIAARNFGAFDDLRTKLATAERRAAEAEAACRAKDEALRGVLKVANRQTVEFDAARDALGVKPADALRAVCAEVANEALQVGHNAPIGSDKPPLIERVLAKVLGPAGGGGK